MRKRFLKPIFKILFFSLFIAFIFGCISLVVIKSTQKDKVKDDSTVIYPPIVSDNVSAREFAVVEQFNLASAENFNSAYDVTPKAQKAGTVRVPVLTYHHVAPVPNNSGRDYFVSPEIFRQQLEYLSEKGYKTLTPQEFYDILASGKNPIQKSVLLTFDDGNYDNYKYAFPLLKEYHMTGTFYVPSHRSAMKSAQLKEMADAGMVIDPHGKTHMMLRNVTNSDSLYQELVVSKNSIESITGKKVVSFCYPGCEYNGSVTSTLASNGYLVAFSCGMSIDHKLGARFVLSRMHVYDKMDHFKSILSGVGYYPY